ncbi:methyltransferase family protein [Sphaerotilus mobilis]|uniref:Methyltransferase family protein n=1 Tax=Sphaerotilus mobilis TaxID=47994 RepID=A0A4Q7LBU5_9BURK|nr:methyltransferase family protein [Sphaerotilus mobilis]
MTPQPSLPESVELEDRPCPLGCAPSDVAVLSGCDRIHGLPGRFNVVCCGQCGLTRTNPRPTASTIGAYYPADYAPYLAVDTRPGRPKDKFRHRLRSRLTRFWGRDTRRLPAILPGHMLEVGCASGNYLREMKPKGWTVEGIEFSDHAAAQARETGLHVQTSSIEGASEPQMRPDLIAAWMVLEHLHEPIAALRKLRGWIKDDGYLVGAVPDFDAFDRRIFGTYWYALHLPAHLYHYNQETLKAVLAQGGWELIKTRWQTNELNLLRTVEYKLIDAHSKRRLAMLRWFNSSRVMRKARRWLGWLLGVTHQSGRMEFWARPLPNDGKTS